MSQKKLSRRDFLRLSGAATAGAMVVGLPALKPGANALPFLKSAYDVPASAAIAQTGKYKESPMLAARVAAGTLPTVDERLPEEPRVRTPPAVGKYGGVIHEQGGKQGGHFFLDGAQLVFPQQTNNDGTVIEPDLCTKVDISADVKEFTFYFRKGLKWSDGTPFTVDDILWWWNEEQLNTDLFPQGPYSTWRLGDKLVEFSKVDDYTLKITSPEPYRPILNMSAHERMSLGGTFGEPVKYMSQFHIKFNPDADKVAKELGFDFWYQAYTAREYHLGPYANKPHMGPWVKVESTTSREVFERNAFYHEVDTEGQQLPYIDYIYYDVVTDATLRETAVLAGQMTCSDVRLSQIEVAKANQEKGDFHILNWANSNPSQCVLAFNLNHKNPVLREIYNDRRFRMAMSYAINRNEMNDTLYFGLAKPYQAMINPKASYFKEEWLTKYADFDVDKANALLDEMGLQWDADHKWRLRPDGERLTSSYLYYPEFTVEHLELVRGYWEAVGHELIITEVARALRDERGKAADHDITGWNVDLAEEIACYLPYATKFQPNLEMYYAVNWWQWFETKGKAGEEPPQAWKDQFDRMAAWYAAPSDAEYKRLAQEVWQFFSDEVPLIGTIGYPPMPTLTKNGLTNVPEVAKKGYGTLHAQTFYVQQWFWEDPTSHSQ